MKKARIDRQQDFALFVCRPLIYIWMWADAKRKVNRDPSVSFRRKEPYVMLANHTYLFDVVHVPMRFRITPFIIASQTLLTNKRTRFLVTQMAHVIPKSKGKSDISTIIKIFNVIKKGYPILIFPEGDTTFFGETGHIEEATMKLVKKLGVDVITCNVKGGYLSRPRWSTGKRKNHHIELNYNLTIPKEKLKELSPSEIGEIVNKTLYHNDYEYQRTMMIPHPGKHLAEGMENVVYVCPHCLGINTITTEGNRVICQSCHTEGFVDEYGFIHGFKYDNLIEWDKFQKQYDEKLRETVFTSPAELYFLHPETEERIPVGKVTLTYNDHLLHLAGEYQEDIAVDDISNVVITLRREFQFSYNDKHYLIVVDKHIMAFLRACQSKY